MGKQFFIDFDGTITTKDTVVAMVESFAGAGWQELNQKWENKQITTEECARRTLELFETTPDELQILLNTIDVDKYFSEFLRLCTDCGYEVYILSDGYDFNIEHILIRNDINVPYYSNKLLYTDRFDIECPYINEECNNCGTCKTKLMQQLHAPGCLAVYIGDGCSDTCPAQYADIVFAKDSLLQFCLENGIKTIPFKSFRDIIDWMERN